MENAIMADLEPKPVIDTKPSGPRRITKLSDLQQMVDEKFLVEIQWLNQGNIEIEGRRLTPAETTTLTDLIHSVLPPSIKGAKLEDDRFDFNNKEYIKQKRQVANRARAVGIYWAFQIFRDDQPNLKEFVDIEKFIQSKLTESILEVLWLAIQDGGVRKSALINFYSAGSRTNSGAGSQSESPSSPLPASAT